MDIFRKIFNKRTLVSLSLFIVYSILLTFTIEAITRGGISNASDFVEHFFSKFSYNCFVVALTLSPCFLFKRRLFGFSLITSIWVIFSIGNNLVMKFRGTPLTGADLGMIKNGLELSSQYLTSSSLLLIIGALILLIVALVVLFIKSPKVKMNYVLNIISLVLFIIVAPKVTDYALKNNVISKNFWDITGKYKEYGFAFSFLNSIVNTGMDKPQGYSASLIEKTIDRINLYSDNEQSSDVLENNQLLLDDESDVATTANKSISGVSEETPNIIIVQLESFIDPDFLKDVTFNKEVAPNFKYLKDNYSSGLLAVPSIGGGTANTEFEVVTGFSTSFFGAGEFPFNTLLSSKTAPSLASYLKDYNYDADAMHNHDGAFYCRDSVYKNLGFDTFTPYQVMGYNNTTPLGWSKDTLLLPEIKLSLEKSENPSLVFAVSVQGHGGYPDTKVDGTEIEITSNYTKDNKYKLEYYLQQVHEMDMFIGQLIELVQSTNEPTVIAFYGDHFPSLGLTPEDLTTENLKKTPYAIWDNLGLEQKDEDLKAYEITAKILSSLNFPNTTLTKLHNSNIPTEEKLQDLEVLQYDMIYGKNYTGDYRKPVVSSNFKYGLRNFVLNSVTVNDGYIEVKGENFNTASRITVNGDFYDTEYIDEHTLRTQNTEIKSGDTVVVKQANYNNTNVYTTSNEYNFK